MIADRTAYDVRYTAWQTIKPVSVASLRTVGTHDPIQRVEFMNAPKLNPPKCSSSRSQWITERNTTNARLIVCLKLIHVRVFFDLFFSVRIRTYFIFLETRITGLHFAADSMFLRFFVAGSVNTCILKQTVQCQECVSAIQGHPGSLMLVPIESAYATSY